MVTTIGLSPEPTEGESVVGGSNNNNNNKPGGGDTYGTVSMTVEATSSPTTNNTFICIISDLTSVTNTCQKQVINLSGHYQVGQLIQEVADHFHYDPFTFNLMWITPKEMINLSELNDCIMSLNDLGLYGKSHFEIHEKDGGGGPRRVRSNSVSNVQEEENWDEPNCFSEIRSSLCSASIQTYPPTKSSSQRRNAQTFDLESPAADSNHFLNDSSSTSSNITPATTTTLADNSFGILNSSNMIEYGPAALDSSTGCFVPYSPSSYMMPTTSNNYMANAASSSDNNEETGFVGLINQAMTCYLNSLLQTLFMTPEFRNGIYKWKHTLKEEEDCQKNIPFQLQRLFLSLQTSKKKSIQTHDLTKSFGWNNDDAFQQHDVQELCRVMFDALEKTFKGTQQQNLINELYQGKIKDYVKCLECEIESAREDVFLDIPLCIRPFGSDKTFESVEEALDSFVQPEILDDNNKYFCSNCQRQCKAHKGLKFVSFPYIISLQLKRFDFDYKTLSRFKLSNRVTFPEILNVQKYLDHDHDDEETKEKGGLYDYELFSIMIHSGSATGGHYYAYIKCTETNQWLNFNDERVSKLDREDIKKAYGTQFSLYSSTTAYMLLYRQVNAARNEKPIRVDEFDEHLKQLLEREIEQQLEAQRLKEYMENVCKVKVVMPSLDKVHDSLLDPSTLSSSSSSSMPVKLQERTVEVHKDLRLDEAKEQLIKEFHLEEYIREKQLKCRILKYDTYNEIIDECYNQDETSMTVIESLGFTKYPYNICWYFEMVPEHEPFVCYNRSDLTVRVVGLDTSSLETHDLCQLRVSGDSSVLQLRQLIAERINVTRADKLKMVLEGSRGSSLGNFSYLNGSLDQLLRFQGFTRVNKVFVEYDEESDDDQLVASFGQSKLFYALEAIYNMLQISVYLPTQDQSECFLKKSKRHALFIQTQAEKKKKKEEQEEEETRLKKKQEEEQLLMLLAQQQHELDSYDIISSVQSSTNTLSSINISENNESHYHHQHQITQKTIVKSKDQIHSEEEESRMSLGETIKSSEETINLIEDHFTRPSPPDLANLLPIKGDNRGVLSSGDGLVLDMETSFDEGIGSTGSLSATTTVSNGVSANTATINKTAQQQQQHGSMSPPPPSSSSSSMMMLQMDAFLAATELSPIFKSAVGGNEDDNDDDNANDDDADLDVNIDDSEINNLDDVDFSDLPVDLKSSNDDEDDVDDLRSNDDNYGAEEDLLMGGGSVSGNRNVSKEVKSLNSEWDDELEEHHHHSSKLTDINKKYALNASPPPPPPVSSSVPDLDNEDTLPSYDEINAKTMYNNNKDSTTTTTNHDNQPTTDSRFIKSKLTVNTELGTRQLQVKMDKRIELAQFKAHLGEYLSLSPLNFRVFRMCPNETECELTADEKQFFYLQANSKFVIKLGPPLNYGEYMLPVYQLKKTSITYLCDFMLTFHLSVQSIKELLVEDLRDECSLDIPVEKLRLRRKDGKRPSTIYLNSEIFGIDIFVNTMTELCIEVLEGPEAKTQKSQASIYLRQWRADEFELGELCETVLEGNTYDLLLDHISKLTGIDSENLELYKCKMDYPYKVSVLNLHRDVAWRENFGGGLSEKLEDGQCFYYRDKTVQLGSLSDEKRRDLEREDTKNFSSTRSAVPFMSKKEKGIKIHVNNV